MRGAKAKSKRRAPVVVHPRSVVARITIVAFADGRVAVRNLPDNERTARMIMTRAVDRMAEHFEKTAGASSVHTA